MLGIIFGAAGMVFVYYTVQTIFGPVDEEFYLGYCGDRGPRSAVLGNY